MLGLDLGGDAFAFGFFVAAADHPYRLAVAQFTPQLFLEHVRVVGDQRIGGLEDAAGGAVVLFQHDHLERREVLLELHQIFRPCAAPGVDRLVIVTDHGKACGAADQHLDQQVLAGIGVLVFIHQHVANAELPFLQHIRVILK